MIAFGNEEAYKNVWVVFLFDEKITFIKAKYIDTGYLQEFDLCSILLKSNWIFKVSKPIFFLYDYLEWFGLFSMYIFNFRPRISFLALGYN